MDQAADMAIAFTRHMQRMAHPAILECGAVSKVPYMLLRGVYGANGYVILPPRALRRLDKFEDIGEVISAPHGLTFCDMVSGVCGFDTSFPGSKWSDQDAVALSATPKDAEMLTHTSLSTPLPGRAQYNWSIEELRHQTAELARQVAGYNGLWPVRVHKNITVRPTRGRVGRWVL